MKKEIDESWKWDLHDKELKRMNETWEVKKSHKEREQIEKRMKQLENENQDLNQKVSYL